MYLFSPIANATPALGLWEATDVNQDMVIFCGTHLGKGMVAALQLANSVAGAGGASETSVNAISTNLLNDADTGVSYINNTFIRVSTLSLTTDLTHLS